MQGSSFDKVRRRCGAGRLGRISLNIGAACSALLIPLLVLVLGLTVHLLVAEAFTVHLLVEHDGASTATGMPLGFFVDGKTFRWPFFGRSDYCLLWLTGLGLFLSLLEALSLIVLHGVVHRAALGVASHLKSGIHSHAFRLGSSDLLGASRSHHEDLFTDKVEAVRLGMVTYWRTVPRGWVAVVALLLLAVAVNAQLTLLAMLVALVIWRASSRLRQYSQSKAEHWAAHAAQRHDLLVEDMRLTTLATGYSLTDKPGAPFDAGLREYQSSVLRAYTSKMMAMPLTLLMVLAGVTLLTLVIGFNVLAEPPRITIADSVVWASALICAYFPAARLSRLRKTCKAVEEAADEIYQFLERQPSVTQVADARPMPRLQKEIQLDHVTLADRNGHKLLSDVSVTIPAGGKIALVASDPQTAVALSGLFVRYYDPAAGRILMDSLDLHHATIDSLRRQALLLTADGLLFTGTVANNIGCGDPRYSVLQITEAVRKIKAYDFIQQLPKGLETVVGSHGDHLKDWQAFLIALARAVLREPSLLVVEDVQNKIDDSTAAIIDEALHAAAEGRTLLLLPNRMATLRWVDRIYLFHEGHLHAQGTHAELLQSSELYRHWTYLRFNPFRDKVR
jgi:ATP-binding cassette subfamily B protein